MIPAVLAALGLSCGTNPLPPTGAAPNAPALTATDPASPAANASPLVLGSADAGVSVSIFASADCSGTALATGVADQSGRFSIRVTLAAGTTSLSANATQGGAVSACSALALRYTFDATAPDAPILSSSDPASPSRTTTTPSILGWAEAGATVKLFTTTACEGAPAATGVANAMGAFSIAATVAPNSRTTFRATATDAVGNVSGCSASSLLFVHDSTAPGAPEIRSSQPASPSRATTTPNLAGVAEPATLVDLFESDDCSGTSVARTKAQADGSFSADVLVAENDATHFTARATDAAGNASACSAPFVFVHDALAPDAPTWTATAPSSPSNSVTTPVLSGRAEAGSTVRVYAAAGCGRQAIATATADGSGAFSATVSVPTNSTTTFYAAATDAAGNVSACSASALVYVHDAVAPDAPRVLASDPGSPSRASLAPTLSGTAEAGALVRVYANDAACAGTPVASIAAGQDGRWSVAGAASANATTLFRATATDAAGNASPCSTSAFAYVHDALAPDAPVLTATAPASPSRAISTPTVSGTAEAGAKVEIFGSADCSSAALGSGYADPSGHFAVLAACPPNSTITFHARATDAAGNASSCGGGNLAFTHDALAPAAPVFTGSTPASPNKDSTTPRLSGSAEPGALVTVFKDPACSGAVVGTVTAAGDGVFSLVVTVARSSTTSFYANATDAAGNASACANAALVYVHDDVAPSPPVLTSTSPSARSNSSVTPIVRGTAEAFSTIRIYASAGCGGAVVATGTASAAGAFGVMTTVAQNSTTTFFATAADAVGNTSGCSTTSVTFVSDTLAPDTPRLIATTPPSPSNASTTPILSGSAEPGSVVGLYTSAGCTGAPIASGPTDANGAFDFTVSVARNSATAFYASATDAAGNLSGCSEPGLPFTHDDTAPAAPTLTATAPASPSRLTASPAIKGNAETGSTVALYSNSSCTGSPLARGSAATFASTGITAGLTANATTTLYATATDAAGNTSACGGGLAFTHDDTPPTAPSALSTSPVSPSRTVTTPSVLGSAEAGSTIDVYASADCSGTPLATGTAAAFASPGLAITVAADSTTTLRAKATDAAGNVSACSAGVTYVHDDIKPAAPTTLATLPPSPSNATTTPRVTGAAEAGSTVSLFQGTSCTGALLATGPASDFAGVGLQISVTPNTQTTIAARATDAAGNVSDCSASVSFVHDTIAPVSLSGFIVPASPANNNHPVIAGFAEPGATVTLYTQAGCAGAPAGSGVAVDGSFSITVTVADDSSTSFYARVTDAAGNVSDCSAGSPAYVEDSTPPAAPTALSTTPTSPSRTSTTPTLSGTAEAGATVRVYAGSCTGTPLATATAAAFATGLSVTVPANSTTTLRATATDAAGNVSTCSTGVAYVHDNVAPNPPTSLGVTPTSPGSSTTPTVSASAEPSSSVSLFGNAACSGTALASGSASAGGAFSATVTVAPNSTTTFFARATDLASNVSACSTSSVTYSHDGQPPTVPTGVVALPVSNARVDLSWNASTDASGVASYRVYRNGTLVGSPTTTAFSNTGLAATTTYSYTVSAVDPGGNESAQSAAVTATTFGAGTQVSGTISSNTTWSVANAPFTAVGNVTVASGAKLTIDPCARVVFQPGFSLTVNGTLDVRGTAACPVVFTSAQATPAAGDWGYIQFTDTSTDATFDVNGNFTGGSILQNVKILYGGGVSSDWSGLRIDNSAPFIDRCEIAYNRGGGIYATNAPNLRVSNGNVHHNTGFGASYNTNGGGITLQGGSGTLTNNTIANNQAMQSGGGIALLNTTGATTITGNTLRSNSASGNDFGAGGVMVQGPSALVTISGNTIVSNTGNSGYGGAAGGVKVRYNSGGNVVIDGNTITDNSSGQAGGVDLGGGGFGPTAYATITNNLIARNGGAGISVFGDYSHATTVSGNIVAASAGVGVSSTGGQSIAIENNTIVANGGFGVATSTSGHIGTNSFIGNVGGAVTISGGTGTMDANLVTGSRGRGAIEVSTSGWSVTGNNLQENSLASYALYFAGPASATLAATGNYWGTSDAASIQARIFDWNSDASKGVVDPSAPLAAPASPPPVSPPLNVVKAAVSGGVQITWAANPEPDTAGYKVYWGTTDGGYTFANSADVGNVTSYTVTGASITDVIAVTAYDITANGINDRQDGSESWYATSGSPAPRIALSATSVSFGAVSVGQGANRTLTLRNPGTADLTVTNVVSSNLAYAASPTSFTVTPGQSRDVTITLTPTAAGSFSGTLSVTHNAVGSPTAVSLLGVGVSGGGTVVSGILTTNTTWTLAGSPYLVTGNVRVNSGVTLTIQPGVNVLFDSGKSLQVSGTLVGRGTAGNLIVFGSMKSSPAAGDWGYVQFADTSVDATYDVGGNYTGGSILEYFKLSYGGGLSSDWSGLRVDNASPFISQCEISYNRGGGIYATSAPNLHVSNCSIHHNTRFGNAYDQTGGGIVLSSGSGTLTNNTINDNLANQSGGGIALLNTNGACTVTGNTIRANQANGNDFGAGGIMVGGPSALVTIRGNTITSNSGSSGYGGAGGGVKVRYQSGGNVVIDANTILDNTSPQGGGIDLGGGGYGPTAYATITNNIVARNGSTGIAIFADYSQPTIVRGNVIAASTGAGLTATSGQTVTIENNTIVANAGLGLSMSTGGHIGINSFIDNVGGAVSIGGGTGTMDANLVTGSRGQRAIYTNTASWPVTGNNLQQNSLATYTLYFDGGPSATLNARGNWWGTTSATAIQARIFDWNNDASKGVVDPSSSLSSPAAAPPVSPPLNVVKTAVSGGVQVSWAANPEADVVGYRVYWGSTDGGYTFPSSANAGLSTTYTIVGAALGDTIAVTAYDSTADGINDRQDGAESWFAQAGSAAPRIALSTNSLGMGAVNVGQSAQQTLTVQNVGTAALNVTGITSTSPAFSASPTTFSIAPGGSQSVTVTFAPTATGSFGGTLSIAHNATGSPSGVSLLGVGVTSGGTVVSGILTSNTTWTTAGSPYLATGNLRVNSGVTLTIQPGVTVQFDSGKSLQVSGTLNVQGSAGNLVTFTSMKGTPAAGDWGYIQFTNTSVAATYDVNGNYTGGSILKYCKVSYGGGLSAAWAGVWIDTNAPLIDHCEISYNRGGGIYATSAANLHVTNSLVQSNTRFGNAYDNTGGGIVLSGGSGTFTGNTVLSNLANQSGGGIALLNTTGATLVSNNVIQSNQANGNDFGAGGVMVQGPSALVTISGNVIKSNSGSSGYGGAGGGVKVRYNSGGSVVITQNTITDNTSPQGGGIDLGGGGYGPTAYATITGNIILRNSSTGISAYTDSAQPTSITGNVIGDNASTGILLAGYGAATVQQNSVVTNGGIGLSVGAYGTMTVSMNSFLNNAAAGASLAGGGGTFNNNLVSGSGGRQAVYVNLNGWTLAGNNLQNNSAATYTLYYDGTTSQTLNAQGNYWGTTDAAVIATRIFDNTDDVSKGVVNVTGFLAAPSSTPPISPPQSVSATPSAGQIAVAWAADAEADVAGYRVYWSSASGFPPPNVQAVTAGTSKTLTGLTPGTYYVTVTAYDSTYAAANDNASTPVNENQAAGSESWYTLERVVVVP